MRAAWEPRYVWGDKNGTSKLYTPVIQAFHETMWSNEDLDKIGLVIQGWDGEGQFDNLTSVQLKDYIKSKPASFGKTSKRPGPPRFRSWQIVHAATIVLKQGAAIRKLLKLDVEDLTVPTLHARAVAAEARVAELEVERDGLKALIDKAVDAKRKANERKAEQQAKAAERANAKKAKAKAEQRQQVARQVEKQVEKQVAATKRHAEAAIEASDAKRQKDVAAARARARAVESSAKLSGKRLRRMKKAEAAAKELREQLDDALASDEDAGEDVQEQPSKLSRRGTNGRFQAGPWQQRALEYAQLGRGVAPSAINSNITEVLTIYASHAVVPQHCERQMRKLRSELTIAGEMIAALRVALSCRIISFGFDESTKFGLGLLSTNTQIEPHDAPGTSVDVVMRGVTLTAGGTAQEISKDIEEKLFAHARRLLNLWKDEHESMHGKGSWAKAKMPPADNVGLHRLSENAVLMSDTCNAARAVRISSGSTNQHPSPCPDPRPCQQPVQ